jgi:hypothetical protein
MGGAHQGPLFPSRSLHAPQLNAFTSQGRRSTTPSTTMQRWFTSLPSPCSRCVLFASTCPNRADAANVGRCSNTDGRACHSRSWVSCWANLWMTTLCEQLALSRPLRLVLTDYSRVIDVFAMPQSGTGVSVESVDEVYQTKMMDMLKQTGRCVSCRRSNVLVCLTLSDTGQRWLSAGIIPTPASVAGCLASISTLSRCATSFPASPAHQLIAGSHRHSNVCTKEQ